MSYFSHVIVKHKSSDVESSRKYFVSDECEFKRLCPNVLRYNCVTRFHSLRSGIRGREKSAVRFADLSTTVAADAGSAFVISSESRAADKKVVATWRATHHAPEFLGEMLPMDGVIHGGGCSLGGRRWVDTGWLRRRRHHGMNECPVYPSAPLSATTVSRDSS